MLRWSECQTILIDVQTVFHLITWTPTSLPVIGSSVRPQRLKTLCRLVYELWERVAGVRYIAKPHIREPLFSYRRAELDLLTGGRMHQA